MKSVEVLIWSLVFFAVLLTGVGGILNMVGTESVSMRFTSQHSWNDGLFLMLLAILIAVLYK